MLEFVLGWRKRRRSSRKRRRRRRSRRNSRNEMKQAGVVYLGRCCTKKSPRENAARLRTRSAANYPKFDSTKGLINGKEPLVRSILLVY